MNLDPDSVDLDSKMVRDVRQIGHYGTGDLEITIRSKEDIDEAESLINASYEAS